MATTVYTQEVLVKRTPESRKYTMDFSLQPEIKAGDTIVTINSITAVALDASLLTPPTLGTQAIASGGQQVTVVISGSADPSVWEIRFVVTTALGSVLEGVGTLDVQA